MYTKCVKIKICLIFRTRNCSLRRRIVGIWTDCCKPVFFIWYVINECRIPSTYIFPNSSPTIQIRVVWKRERDWFEPCYCWFSGWVWCLYPFIATITFIDSNQLRITKLKMKSIARFKIFQLIQDWVEISRWIITVFAQSIFRVWEKATISVVVENFGPVKI